MLHSFSRLLDDHKHHDLSSQGFGLLEKALLHPEDCVAGPSHWLQCFRCVVGVVVRAAVASHCCDRWCREVVFPVVNAKFESRSPKSPDNFRMRLFVLVTSSFATHAKSMATIGDFQAVWLQLLALLCVSLQCLVSFHLSSVLSCDWANKIRELDDAASYSSALEVCCAAPRPPPPLSFTRGLSHLNSPYPASSISFAKPTFPYCVSQVCL